METKPHTGPEPLKYIDLFAGIGGLRIPWDELGAQCVFSSEWDKKCQETYRAWFNEEPEGDITEIEAADIPAHDLLLAGFPCQPFSVMGKGEGFSDTRGTLFYDIERILAHHRPSMLMLENVKRLVSHDQGRTIHTILEALNNLGYSVSYKVLNALDFGLPQNRERVILVGFLNPDTHARFTWPEPRPGEYDLSRILEPETDIDPSLYASEYIRTKRAASVAGKDVFYPSMWHENKSGNISILPYSVALRTGASYNYNLVNGDRRPSSRELLRLQGFSDDLPIVVSHGEVRRQTGNAVPPALSRPVAQKMTEALAQTRKENS